MLNAAKAFSSFSVNDLKKAKEFYQSILGLEVKSLSMEGYELMELQTGSSRVIVYPKDDHKPATFTVLNFPVKDIETEVAALKQKGVKFEHYDAEGIKTDERGISRSDSQAVAWFTDPAGNILSVMQEQ